MAGDYTRLTFDPLRDRAMLLEQQGRVHLDADFNELAAIFERRLRVETRDVVGPAVYPVTEPSSFKISFGPGGVLQIGRGRMYVDGLVAENHGTGAMSYEPVWDEPRRAQDTPIDKQPYQGTPQPTAFTHDELVYLDVWQRELTCVEDPSVLEPALGVDTATRVQTAWQVRHLKLDDDTLSCKSDWSTYKPWLDLTRPSAGRLTSNAVKPPDPADPCAVAPVGGYRGLENRLYRVEVHDGGGAGAATLKWSRDNGAVAARITALTGVATQPIITVERLGRDRVLRFHPGEWVELLDDVLELDGKPGLIGKVLQTDATESTVTLSAPLAGGVIDLTRNPRLRRWDQKAGVSANGVIPVPAFPATVALEDGVEVTLELADPAGIVHTGDWWVFAARAAIGDIEHLDKAPPRGVRHHFASLAVIHGDAIEDCRIPWPGACECDGEGCECTACVTPESHADDGGEFTIQMAIDKVTPTGGRVCLAPGRYRLRKSLVIEHARGLTLAAHGLGTVIEFPGAVGILVRQSIDVSLEHLTVIARRGDQNAGAGTVGIALSTTAACRVERCAVFAGTHARAVGIGLAGWSLRTRLLENAVLAGIGVGDLSGASWFDEAKYMVMADLAVEDNLLFGLRDGIAFGATPHDEEEAPSIYAAATRIARNVVMGGSDAGISLVGLVMQPAGASGAITSVAATPAAGVAGIVQLVLRGLAVIAVTDNVIVVGGDGVRGVNEGLVVEDNKISGTGFDRGNRNCGVRLGSPLRIRDGHARVAQNTISDFDGAGVMSSGDAADLEVHGNRIARTGEFGILARGRERGLDAVRVIDNVLSDVAALDGKDDVRLVAILVSGARRVAVSDNLVRAAGANMRGPAIRAGIHVELSETVHVDGNQLLDIGPTEEFAGELSGIFALECKRLDVRGNTVDVPGSERGGPSRALSIRGLEGLKESPGGAFNLAAGVFASHWIDAVPPGLDQLAVHGNTLHAGGVNPIVEVQARANITFADNRCRWTTQERGDPIVRVRVDGATIVSANHVEGPQWEGPAVELDVSASTGSTPHCTVVGNITSGRVELNGGALPAPWHDLNIVA